MSAADAPLARNHYAALEECTYLNQASLGLVPRASIRAMTTFLVDVAQHGNVRLSDQAEARVLDGVREAAAELLDAPSGQSPYSAVRARSSGRSPPPWQPALTADAPEVLLVSTDFPSVTYPWLAASRRTTSAATPVPCWVEDEPSSDLTDQILSAITERTGVVCVSAVQYSTGTGVNMPAVTAAAHAVGARVVADVTQLAGAAPVSMRLWGVDALVCSGYKWLSAHGGVALAALSDELSSLVPPVVGWMGAEDPFDFDATSLRLAEGARRYELSTMSYASAVGLQHSLQLLTGTGIASLASHSRDLAHELSTSWSPLGGAHSDHCKTQQRAITSSRCVIATNQALRCRPPWSEITLSSRALASAASGCPCTVTTPAATYGRWPTLSPP